MKAKPEKVERFPIRRASASEAFRTREFIEQTFTDRVSWVAARVLLVRCLPVIEQLSEQANVDTVDLQVRIQNFLDRHPVGKVDPTAGVCPACQEIAHDPDCRLVGDGRPING